MTYFKPNAGSFFVALSLVASLFAATPAIAQVSAEYCGSLANGFGPYDYRSDKYTPTHGDTASHSLKRALVEGAHFTPRVENLIGAQSSLQVGPPGGDLDYTLRAFPNHHRALMAVMRYGEKTGSPKPSGLRYDVECYFERAIRFKPDDTIARIIYSTYLTKNKRIPEAVAQLEQATRLAEDNAFTHYNIGLAYFDMKIYDKALDRAHKAMALGFERTELRDLLEKQGQWREPIAAATENPSASPADTPASAPKPEQ